MEKDKKPSESTLKEWHKNPSNWKFGVFYYNKEDKRIFPPKRISAMGWTINFSNTKSIVVFLVLIALLLLLIRWL